MSERRQALLLLTAAIASLYCFNSLLGKDGFAVWFALVIFAYRGWIFVRYLIGSWRLRQATRVLRRYDLAGRDAALRNIRAGAVRAYLAETLAEEGEPQVEAGVGRYPFSARTQRIYATAEWVGLIVTGAALLWAWSAGGRAGQMSVGVAALALAMVWGAGRRLATLRTVLEVSAFRVTEVLPTGVRRTILLNQPLLLRNEPRRGRFWLQLQGTRDGIAIHYDRLGFYDAIERIITSGGFARPDSST